jgi:hypothetical protein
MHVSSSLSGLHAPSSMILRSGVAITAPQQRLGTMNPVPGHFELPVEYVCFLLVLLLEEEDIASAVAVPVSGSARGLCACR